MPSSRLPTPESPLGEPKKLAKIEFGIDGGEVQVSMAAMGSTIIEINGLVSGDKVVPPVARPAESAVGSGGDDAVAFA